MAQGFSSSKELLEFLQLPQDSFSEIAEQQFKTRIPRSFAARMQSGNPKDPLLLQVLASLQEEESPASYALDALQENKKNPLPGLLHKYQGRVLIIFAGACAIHCRYCFRRHFPYQENNPGREGLNDILEYVKKDESIHEVILSGGDPLVVADAFLEDFLNKLSQIPHLRTIRFHTRIPIVLPERITGAFLAILEKTPLRKVIVIHANHAQEINAEVAQACKDLRAVGCHVLNQSVLLKNINDDATTLKNLSEKLFDCGVLPYYLHLLDRVRGSAHFEVSEERIKAIYQQLQRMLPGYLLPRLAREEPGKSSKTLIYS